MTVPVSPPAEPNEFKAHLVGGGIASLASALYLIEYGGFQGKNVTIYEATDVMGGSMDAHGDPKKGYLMRGGRMFDKEVYTALYDLLSHVPSARTPGKTLASDIADFSAFKPTDSHARLIEPGPIKDDASKLGLNIRDKAAFSAFLLLPESGLDGKKINEYFTSDFFTSNFWLMMRSTFAFQPWHSLTEFQRYCLRFIHEVPKLYNLSGVWRTPLNQYDSIIAPLETYLKSRDVNFTYNVRITNFDFEIKENERSIYRIYYERKGVAGTIDVARTDLVFTTLGSLTAASIIGDTQHAPKPAMQAEVEQAPAWALWKEIARKQPDFGRPEVFYGDYKAAMFESFSLTWNDNSKFFDRYVKWSENEPGTGALVTFKKSAWGMSLVVPHQASFSASFVLSHMQANLLAYQPSPQPHFANQPENCQVAWAYGLFPDEIGEFVKKPMRECTGEELFFELCSHLGFADEFEEMKVRSLALLFRVYGCFLKIELSFSCT
ncbi:hypothetical protein HDU93_002194 [Gonapodya sp. JEL0774]|nr:hypothetical protein HDU93_002194 [Gonapodya sp. JEL0774]